MPRLTDELWLAAHDNVNGKSLIGDWPLGVGLAAGLLAELIRLGSLDLRQGELFRAAGAQTRDVALSPLLAQMEKEERGWTPPSPAPPPPPTRVRARVQMEAAWPSPPLQDGQALLPPAPEENRHRQRGHQLSEWFSYLTYEDRAEALVTRRLARAGWVTAETHRRWWSGRTTTRYFPSDSVVTGSPAAAINEAVRRGRDLGGEVLLLAGLFLATGLDVHALATLAADERSRLSKQLARDLPAALRELLLAGHAAIGEAAMRQHR